PTRPEGRGSPRRADWLRAAATRQRSVAELKPETRDQSQAALSSCQSPSYAYLACVVCRCYIDTTNCCCGRTSIVVERVPPSQGGYEVPSSHRAAQLPSSRAPAV